MANPAITIGPSRSGGPMNARRAWTVWAHAVLGSMIAIEIAFVVLAMVYVMPKCRQIVVDADVEHRGVSAFLPGAGEFLAIVGAARHFAVWWLVLLLVACAG